MKKEFTEQEIYDTEKEFKDFVYKQYRRERAFFFKLAAIVLGLLSAGFLACLFLIK